MVRRRHADLLVAALALPLPAGGVSVRAAARGERAARAGGPRIRARRHRDLRRGPLLADHGRLREGRADRRLPAPAHPQRGARRGRAPRAADALVPQPLVLGRRRADAPRSARRMPAERRGRGHRRGGAARPLAARRRPAPRRARARAALLRERDQRPRVFGAAPTTPYPKDGINDHVVHGAADGQSGARGTKIACWYRRARRAPARPSSSGCAWRARTDGATPGLGADFERAMSPTASARPTSSTRACARRGDATTRRR